MIIQDDNTRRPKDPNLLARSVVEDLIGAKIDGQPLVRPVDTRNQAAPALSKLGGASKGARRARRRCNTRTRTPEKPRS